IQSAEDPKEFLKLLDLCSVLEETEIIKYKRKAETLIQEKRKNKETTRIEDYFLGAHLADRYTGYRQPDLDKFTEMAVFFAQKLKPFKTKMNKLLFYSDFLSYKRNCYSISGIRYQAIQMGPVPYKFQGIYEYLMDNDLIDKSDVEFPQGYTGVQFIPKEG